jgi:hypothetical protein
MVKRSLHSCLKRTEEGTTTGRVHTYPARPMSPRRLMVLKSIRNPLLLVNRAELNIVGHRAPRNDSATTELLENEARRTRRTSLSPKLRPLAGETLMAQGEEAE